MPFTCHKFQKTLSSALDIRTQVWIMARENTYRRLLVFSLLDTEIKCVKNNHYYKKSYKRLNCIKYIVVHDSDIPQTST